MLLKKLDSNDLQQMRGVARALDAPPQTKRMSKARRNALTIALLISGFAVGAGVSHDETNACHPTNAKTATADAR